MTSYFLGNEGKVIWQRMYAESLINSWAQLFKGLVNKIIED